MKWPRLRTRGLMIAVAVIAVAIGLGIQGWKALIRKRACRQRVEYHWLRAKAWADISARLRSGDEPRGIWAFKAGGTETSIAFMMVEWDVRPDIADGSVKTESERRKAVEDGRARVVYHEARVRAWDRAARRSWSSDPIEPPRPPIKSRRLRVSGDD